MITSVSPSVIRSGDTITPETDFIITGIDLDLLPDEVCLNYDRTISDAYENINGELAHLNALQLVSRSDTEMHFRYYQEYTLPAGVRDYRPMLLTSPNTPPREAIYDLDTIED